MAQLFDNDIREIPNIYDFKDWLVNRISALIARFITQFDGWSRGLAIRLAMIRLVPCDAGFSMATARALLRRNVSVASACPSFFAAKPLNQRRLAWCISNKLADKAAGQGSNNQDCWKRNNPAFQPSGHPQAEKSVNQPDCVTHRNRRNNAWHENWQKKAKNELGIFGWKHKSLLTCWLAQLSD